MATVIIFYRALGFRIGPARQGDWYASKGFGTSGFVDAVGVGVRSARLHMHSTKLRHVEALGNQNLPLSAYSTLGFCGLIARTWETRAWSDVYLGLLTYLRYDRKRSLIHPTVFVSLMYNFTAPRIWAAEAPP